MAMEFLMANSTEQSPMPLAPHIWFPDMYPPKETLVLVAYFLISIFGIPGNVVTIWVLNSSVTLRKKPINVLLSHQAFVDLMACVAVIIEEILDTREDVSSLPFVCHFLLPKVFSSGCMVVSAYNMTYLAIERYSAIVNPIKYDPEKVMKRLPPLIIAEWVLCMVGMSLRGWFTEIHADRCLVGIGIFGTWFWDYYPMYIFIISTGIPFVVSSACYVRMLLVLNQSAQQSKLVTDSKSQSVHKLRLAQLNVFKTCLLVLISFILCNMTLQTAILLFIFGFYKSLSSSHFTVGYLLAVLNSCLNPYIYAIRYDDFKQQLHKLVSRAAIPTSRESQSVRSQS